MAAVPTAPEVVTVVPFTVAVTLSELVAVAVSVTLELVL